MGGRRAHRATGGGAAVLVRRDRLGEDRHERRSKESLTCSCSGVGRTPSFPRTVAAFTRAIVPFQMTELTQSVNPIKLREYAAAGLPIVSSPLPEVRKCIGHCDVRNVRSMNGWTRCGRPLTRGGDPAARRKRSPRACSRRLGVSVRRTLRDLVDATATRPHLRLAARREPDAPMHILHIAGARPNFPKLAPVHRAIVRRRLAADDRAHGPALRRGAVRASSFDELGDPASR